MTFLSQYGLFFLQTLTLVIAILLTTAGIIALSSKQKSEGGINITKLNEAFEKQKQTMLEKTLSKKAFKAHLKDQKKQTKSKETDDKPHLYVIDFIGDIKASAVENLRKEITMVLSVAKPTDEVLVNIESGGGTVNSYGLGASQLQRILDQNIPLTVSVDKIAASGGYLMACVANKVLAAPFAIIGSIGVVAQMPNFHRLLKKHDIDFELLTAGEYKRTLTMFGENTDKAREKFGEDLDNIHHVFKDHIADHRQQVNMEKVATGEYWLAKDASNLELIDELSTSDEYIINKIQTHNVLKIEQKTKQSLMAKLLQPAAQILNF